MTFLVTGANGFVGRALCARLLAQGAKVRAAVRDPGAVVVAGTERVVVGNVDSLTRWGEAITGIDCVLHLAARVHQVHETSADPVKAYQEVNCEGTLTLASAARRAGVGRFVFVSSIKVNGDCRETPYHAGDPPVPTDPYGMSKLAAERALWNLSRESGLEVVVVRPPLVYGPGVRANFLRLMELVRLGVPLPFGAVRNSRSLVFVRNLADALATVAVDREAAGHTYLVSDGEDVSTPELVTRIAAAMNKRPRLVKLPPGLLRGLARALGRAASAERLLGSLTVDSTPIRMELGWRPPYTMDAALRETAAWFAQRDRGCDWPSVTPG